MGAGKENRDVPGSRPGSTGPAIVPRATGQVHWAGAESQPLLSRAPDFLGLPTSLCPQTLSSEAQPSQGKRKTRPLCPQLVLWPLSVFCFISPLRSIASLHPALSWGSFWFQWLDKLVHR